MAWRDLFRWGRKSASTLDLFREIYGGRLSSAGKSVNLQTALGVSTVFGCSRLIGNGMAQVPLKLMRESTSGGRVTRLPAKDHPLYDVLGRRPNPWQTSFEFRQLMSWHVEICGNFYAFKNAPLDEIRELIPFQPGEVRVVRAEDMSLTYFVRSAETGAEQPFPAESIWHVRGPSWNSWMGLDWMQAARDAIGLAIATEESQASAHKNGVQTSGIYSLEGTLKPDQYASLRAWIDREHAGASSAGKPMIMDRAAKWQQTQMSGVDAQHLETRRHQVEEICRSMGVLPIMVGYSDKATTYASSEQMFLAHLVHTLAPRWQMYEQSMDTYLLSDAERKEGLYFDFVEEGMIRGSVKDTKDAILALVNGGLMTPNEGRAKYDLNPDEDPESDKLRIPVNVAQESPPVDPGLDPNAKVLIEALALEVRALANRPQPETKIAVDARTTIQEGAVKVSPAPVTVDARTTIAEGAVKLDAPTTNNIAQPEVVVNVKAYPMESEETIERDANGERAAG